MIDLEKLKGFTMNNSPSSFEFVFHVIGESDYRFKASMKSERAEVLKLLRRDYREQTGKALKVFEVSNSTCRDYHTVKGDVKKNVSRMPSDSYLVREESKEESKDFSAYDPSAGAATGKPSRGQTIFSKDKGTEVCLEDFNVKTVIGKGSFGKVFLVEKRSDKQIYAMKSIRKDVLIQNDQIESTKLEKQILMQAKHPFLVSMAYIFQTDQKVYFVMNFIRGGELFTHLNKVRRFPESRAKFYAAQIIHAIGYLHNQNIIYRDIKPENILMGEDGYLFLADFGLAKEMSTTDMATSFCGTPEYLAPEIVKNVGHNHAVDWWSIGILIYEMIVGFPPFYHKNQNTMYELIEKFPVRFPDPDKHKIVMSEEAKDLITKLLTKDPKERIGTEGGMDEIIGHDWFKDINFEELLKKEIDAPFLPDLTTEVTDVSNFDDQFTDLDPTNSMMPQKNLEMVQRRADEFKDFDG